MAKIDGTQIGKKKHRVVDVFLLKNRSVVPLLQDSTNEKNSDILGKNKQRKEIDKMLNKGSKRQHKMLSIHSKVNAFAIKFYDEQLPYGWQITSDAIKSFDKEKVIVMAIRHDRDEQADGIWAVALEKPHYHVIFKLRDNKKKERISTVLSKLQIYYRPQLDDSLIENHGIESIGSFTGYALYLTHETKDAIADNKEIYELSEIVSNLNEDEIKHVRDGFIRFSDIGKKVAISKLEELDKNAFELGYKLKNFSEWYNSLPFAVRSHSKMKTIEESYSRGVQVRMEEGTEITRLCVYIQGSPNTGKTYAVKQALMGKQTLMVSGGGTGKFDRLRPDHEAIIIDDDICPNLLNITDNYICRVYRRNSGNPVWAGSYFIVTSNLTFDEWLETCGIKSAVHKNALATRFYICTVEQENGVSRLALAQPSTRGSIEEQTQRADSFVKFQAIFNQTISQYSPSVTMVDYDTIIDPIYRENKVEKINQQIDFAQKSNCGILTEKYIDAVYAEKLENAKRYEQRKNEAVEYSPTST